MRKEPRSASDKWNIFPALHLISSIIEAIQTSPPRPIPVVHLHLYYSLFVNFFWSWIQQKYSLTLINNSQPMNSLKDYWGPGWLNELGLDYPTTHTSLSPIRRGFAPGFVNYKKGALDSPPQSDKVYQLLAHGQWFSPGTPASSTTKTGRLDIAEILLKVAFQHNKSIN